MADRKKYLAEYYQKNKKKLDERTCKWYADHPERRNELCKIYQRKKRAKIKKLQVTKFSK